MKLKFLGTGGLLGSPVWNCDCETCTSDNPKNKRFRSALFIDANGKNIIIDCGPDFSHQLINNKIRRIDLGLITHAHGDHTGDIAQYTVAKNCTIEAPEDVFNDLFGKIDNKEWLIKRNPGLVLQNFAPKIINGVSIDTVKLEHQKDTQQTPAPCYGYLFNDGKVSFAYCSDYNKILEPEKVKGLDLLISDASGWENDGRGHVGVDGSIEVFKELKPKKMLLTHLPHRIEYNKLVNYLEPHKGIEPAYDGMEIDFEVYDFGGRDRI